MNEFAGERIRPRQRKTAAVGPLPESGTHTGSPIETAEEQSVSQAEKPCSGRTFH